MRIAHLSDLHFGREDPTAVEAVVEDIGRVAPSLVVVTGDLTQRARPDEFRRARAFLDRLAVPWFAVPGNHDVPLLHAMRALDPFRRFRRHIGPDAPPPWTNAEVSIFGLNTAVPWLAKGGHAGPSRMRALTTWAAGTSSRLRIVAAHHPFTRLGASGHSRVRGWRRAIEAMEAAAVDVLLTGHNHVGGHVESRPYVAGGAHRLVIVGAGTSMSFRVRGSPNAYNVLEVEATRISVQERVLEGGAFLGGDPVRFPRA